jgi:peptide/nickel transport system substrate-binding protein
MSSSDQRLRRSRTGSARARLVLGVGALVVGFCIAPIGAGAKGAAGPTLTIALGATGVPLSLDGAKDQTGGFNMVRALTNGSYIHMNPDGSFSPQLATSWRYLKAPPRSGRENKDFELTLRHNVRFSDGTPLDAQAVATWIKYMYGVKATQTTFTGPVSSVDAVGKWTVRIHLGIPNPQMPFAMSDQNNWAPNSSACVANPSTLATQTCGAGPYMVDPSRSVTGDHYTLVQNPYYYDKSKQKWGEVVVRFITNPSSMLQAIQSGQVDVAEGDVSTADAAANSGLFVYHAPQAEWVMTTDPRGVASKAMSDLRVRQALNYAIDRKAIAKAIAGRYGSPAWAFQSADGMDPKYKYQNDFPYNPTKAKSLLAAAGYANGFTIDNVVVGFGTNFGAPLVQAVAKYLDAVGVHLNLNIINGVAWVQALGHPGATELARVIPIRSMWIGYGAYMKPGGVFNQLGGGWNNPTITRLYLKGQRAPNASTYWRQITATVNKQALFLPIIDTHYILYVDKKVKGVRVTGNRLAPIPTEWSPA